jgi:hypothetical protein
MTGFDLKNANTNLFNKFCNFDPDSDSGKIPESESGFSELGPETLFNTMLFQYCKYEDMD